MRLARAAPLLLLLPFASRADERFDHRGAVGLLVGGGVDERANSGPSAADAGTRGLVDLGGTWAIGHNGNEMTAWVRSSLGGTVPGWSLTAGYRGYYGYERVKTFLDLGVAAQLRPFLAAGARIGCGVQYELSPNVGAYLGLGLQLGGGAGLLFSGELVGGLQVRSYLLE